MVNLRVKWVPGKTHSHSISQSPSQGAKRPAVPHEHPTGSVTSISIGHRCSHSSCVRTVPPHSRTVSDGFAQLALFSEVFRCFGWKVESNLAFKRIPRSLSGQRAGSRGRVGEAKTCTKMHKTNRTGPGCKACNTSTGLCLSSMHMSQHCPQKYTIWIHH